MNETTKGWEYRDKIKKLYAEKSSVRQVADSISYLIAPETISPYQVKMILQKEGVKLKKRKPKPLTIKL